MPIRLAQDVVRPLKTVVRVSAMLIAAAVFVFATGRVPPPASAQDSHQAPPRAAEAVNALRAANWKELSKGLEILEVHSALGTRLTALRIDDASYRFSVAQQSKDTGETARRVLDRTDAVLAVNGGFFAAKADGRLFPVGMLIDDASALSQAWRATGGYLAMGQDGRPNVTLSQDGPPEWAQEAIQSKPVILEPGRKWAMRTNGNDLERRTLFCRLDAQNSLLLLVAGQGLSLYEAGWLMRSPSWGGFFDCDAAIALDGGSSTQLHIRDHWDHRVEALAPVQNLLLVHRRQEVSQ